MTRANQMKDACFALPDSVCRENISTASGEKVAHCTEFFRKEVEHKGELIEEKSGKAGIADRGFHSWGILGDEG